MACGYSYLRFALTAHSNMMCLGNLEANSFKLVKTLNIKVLVSRATFLD